ncbi:MAG TPA: carboxypeptidase-like regulatory domain-containing protein, partial [Pyrinomonadaceae bacterium]
SVSGRVTDSSGRGLRGAKVEILNASTNQVRSTTTNTFGNYYFSNLTVGDFYVLSVSSGRKGWSRSAASYTFTLEDNLTSMNFVLK